ncbi:MAG: hypothetical protein IT372_18700 [Polyangiaceae bacterium]|nr:hypothetical protein [Polyangiaceae bacterium]
MSATGQGGGRGGGGGGPAGGEPAGASRLAATVDGAALPDDEARALWTDFSRHMDEHRGDMAGFAKLRGWSSVTPTHQGGRAVLVARTQEGPPAPAPRPPQPQRPGPASPRPGGGGGAKKGKRRRR